MTISYSETVKTVRQAIEYEGDSLLAENGERAAPAGFIMHDEHRVRRCVEAHEGRLISRRRAKSTASPKFLQRTAGIDEWSMFYACCGAGCRPDLRRLQT